MKPGRNGNGGADPPPPPARPPQREQAYAPSLWGLITRRLRAAPTIFGDRVKLVLTPEDAQHWTLLARPYLLVIPTQTRSPQQWMPDNPTSFINPRSVQFTGQFNDHGSEQSYLAANAIDTAEGQLIYVLANWQPPGRNRLSSFRPTQYGGMRISGVRAPDVRVNFYFTFYEQYALDPEPPLINELPFDDRPMLPSQINVHTNGPCCPACGAELTRPNISVSSGCVQPSPPDPCAPQCPPVLFGDMGDDGSK